jgi:hypothetical protein
MMRSARRMRLCSHLHSAGPRPVLEALIAVESGQDLDAVLEDFARLPADFYRDVLNIYHAVGASHFTKPFLICGGQHDRARED